MYIFNWSGGKDSALALFKAIHEHKWDIKCLLTTVSEEHKRVSMHGVREELLDDQAVKIGIPLKKIYLPESASLDVYNKIMFESLTLVYEKGIKVSVFGDIFLEDLRAYREKQLAAIGMQAFFPLWGMNTKSVAHEFIDKGFKSIVTCVDGNKLDKSFAGRVFDKTFVQDLPPNVDPCGENGEFHSFVFDGPLFNGPIQFKTGEVVEKVYPPNGVQQNEARFWFADILPG